jgi:hypothetical protein
LSPLIVGMALFAVLMAMANGPVDIPFLYR